MTLLATYRNDELFFLLIVFLLVILFLAGLFSLGVYIIYKSLSSEKESYQSIISAEKNDE